MQSGPPARLCEWTVAVRRRRKAVGPALSSAATLMRVPSDKMLLTTLLRNSRGYPIFVSKIA